MEKGSFNNHELCIVRIDKHMQEAIVPSCKSHPYRQGADRVWEHEVFIDSITTLVCDDPYIKYYNVHSLSGRTGIRLY